MKYEILRLENITKQINKIKVLENVCLDIYKGEIHVLLGEANSGKSILAKIIAGLCHKDSGKFFFEGREVSLDTYDQARKLGISFIHQEMNLIPNLSIAENLFIGREIHKLFPFIDKKMTFDYTRLLLKAMGLNLDPRTLVSDLTMSQKRILEIVRAISFYSKLIVLDEPLAYLSKADTQIFIENIPLLTNQGMSILYLTNSIDEIFTLADRITVLKMGRVIYKNHGEKIPDEVSQNSLINRVKKTFYTRERVVGARVLRVQGLSADGLLDITFSAKSGEVIGITGLPDSGCDKLAKLLFGMEKKKSGEIWINDTRLDIRNPRDAIKNGINMVMGNGALNGLIMDMSIKHNLTLPIIHKMSCGVFIKGKAQDNYAQTLLQKQKIRYHNINESISKASFSDQIKMLISKYLTTNPKALIFFITTKELAFNTKMELYAEINGLAEKGLIVLFISYDLHETITVSDRVFLLQKGRITGVSDEVYRQKEHLSN